jgi:dihydroneopterin aldolase
MLTIGLRDLRLRAQHGVHPEEKVLGGEYLVNIEVDLRPRAADLDDRLSNTLDYGQLHAICLEVMSTRAYLIEELAERIAAKVWAQHGQLVAKLRLEIRKLNPPLKGQVGAAFVRLEEER